MLVALKGSRAEAKTVFRGSQWLARARPEGGIGG